MKLIIDNGEAVFEPLVCGEVLCESYASGRCSKLTFDVLERREFLIKEGDIVSLSFAGRGVFCGVVFVRRKNGGGVVNITAYDQLRYLKNKDTYVYYDKRASDVVKMIAADYSLRLGDVQTTDYVIRNRIEDNVTLLDMIENALRLELEHSGRRFTLIDEFGKLSLKDEVGMFSGVVLSRDTLGSYSFFSSVDNRSNRVKVSRYENKSGRREVFVAKDSDSESKLGVLQHYVKTADKNEILSEKAASLLALRNRDEKSVAVKDAFGDVSVRGGAGVVLALPEYSGRATVERCLHRFFDSRHLMDLEIRG